MSPQPFWLSSSYNKIQRGLLDVCPSLKSSQIWQKGCLWPAVPMMVQQGSFLFLLSRQQSLTFPYKYSKWSLLCCGCLNTLSFCVRGAEHNTKIPFYTDRGQQTKNNGTFHCQTHLKPSRLFFSPLWSLLEWIFVFSGQHTESIRYCTKKIKNQNPLKLEHY